MANGAGTLEQLALQLAQLLQPLETRLASGDVRGLFAELGLQFPPSLLAQPGFTGALSSGTAAAGQLGPLIAQLETAIENDDTAAILQTGLQLIQAVTILLSAVDTIATELNNAAGSLGMNPADVIAFASELPVRLLNFMLVGYLEGYHPVLLSWLQLAGIVEVTRDPGVPADPTKPPFIRRSVDFTKLGQIMSSPQNALQTLYGWGTPGFDGQGLIQNLYNLLFSLSIPAMLVPGPPPVLRILLLQLTTKTDITPPGLLATVTTSLPAGLSYNVPLLSPAWSLEFDLEGQLDAGVGVVIRPPSDVSLVPPAGSVQGKVSLLVVGSPSDPSRLLLIFGEAGGSRIEAGQIKAGLGGTFRWDASSGVARSDVQVIVEVHQGRVVITLGGADGFIASLLSGVSLTANIDLKLYWSPSTGLHIEGSSAIEIALPTHVTLGPLDIESLYLKLGLASDGSLPAELSSAFKASLGPLEASVDRIGLAIKTTFPAHGGNLGPANLALAFKPPSGVGLAVNAGVVTGGGFLYIDTDRGEYAGALELEVADFLSLHAIGLINTKMPDGSSGFSLLIIITAEFAEGIQLGFGFTLLAVGGLLGLNRGMLLQPLMEGVRTGAVDSIMFPQDVVANAQRIISDLRTIFPPQRGIFLIGPMAKLGWGEPTLVSLSLGVIIEIPGNVAILGVLKLALPTEEEALVVIQVNFAGAIEFDKDRLYFFASLFDSRVLFITIEGEMGVLFGYGANANFVVSVGGFHPQYNPPPLPFPSPRRIEIDILNESFARIRCDGYFAITSETAQFGAHAEFFFGFSAVNVQGHAGLDALFQFSPFHFIVSISTSFSVTVFGLGLFGLDIDLSLEGPTPWHAHGTASISFLFFSIGIGIDVTWGDSRDTTLPPITVMPLLAAELGKQSNWRAVLPSGSNPLVSLRQLDPSEAGFVFHPVGTLRISQRAVPLDLTLDTVGNQKPSDANRFALAVTSAGLAKTATPQEPFASAQFKHYDDAAKLSLQAYSPLDSGIELSSAATSLASGTAITRIVRYDLTVIDTKYRRYVKRFFTLPSALFAHFLRGASVTRCSLSAYRQTQMQPFAQKVTVGPETFAVAHQSNNTVYRPEAASFTSQAAAKDYLDRAVQRDPTLAETLHVLPHFEVTA